MKRITILLSVLLLANACTLRVNEPSGEEKSKIIGEVLELTNQIRLAAESANADGLFLHHSDAPDAAHIIDGKRYAKSQMISNYRGVYAGVDNQQINLGNPVVKVLSSDLVLVASQGDFTSKSKSGGSLSGDVAWTYLWQKQQNTWVLIHAHQSFSGPISPRSGR